MTLIDPFDRTIDYLRVSVTDRCNFRCVYCMPEEGAPVSPKSEILTFEEIERVVRIGVQLGISKVRLTGGEPLVRHDIDKLVSRIGAIRGIRDLSLTTNGFLLRRYADSFAASGLNRVNVSLDTLRPDRFTRLARRGDLATVMDGIEAASEAGLMPIKLNCVVMRGSNDDEVVDFARLTLNRPVNVRFIELMPINWSRDDTEGMSQFFSFAAVPGYRPNSNVTLYPNADAASFHSTVQLHRPADFTGVLNGAQMRKAFISSAEIQSRIEAELGPLEPTEILTNGPARSMRLAGARGTVGFISQITNDMCLRCNRLRLTADGQLRPCLMADGEVDLRTALRNGSEDRDIADLFIHTVLHKPKEHRLEDGLAPTGRNMSQLGG